MEYSDYIESRPAAATLTGAELIAPSQSGEAVKTTFNDVAALMFRGSYDLSTAAYPSSGGTGTAGVPMIGNWWYGINSGAFNVEDLGTITLYRGAMLIYIGGTVSNPASWIVKQ